MKDGWDGWLMEISLVERSAILVRARHAFKFLRRNACQSGRALAHHEDFGVVGPGGASLSFSPLPPPYPFSPLLSMGARVRLGQMGLLEHLVEAVLLRFMFD